MDKTVEREGVSIWLMQWVAEMSMLHCDCKVVGTDGDAMIVVQQKVIVVAAGIRDLNTHLILCRGVLCTVSKLSIRLNVYLTAFALKCSPESFDAYQW